MNHIFMLFEMHIINQEYRETLFNNIANTFAKKLFNSCFKGSLLLSNQISANRFEVFRQTLDKRLRFWELYSLWKLISSMAIILDKGMPISETTILEVSH